MRNKLLRLFTEDDSRPLKIDRAEIDEAREELAAVRAAGTAACRRLEDLAKRRLEAPSFPEAEDINRQIAEAEWDRDHAASRVPPLEAQVAELQDEAHYDEWKWVHWPAMLQDLEEYSELARAALAKFSAWQTKFNGLRAGGFETEATVFQGLVPAIGLSSPVLAPDLLDNFENEVKRLCESGPSPRVRRVPRVQRAIAPLCVPGLRERPSVAPMPPPAVVPPPAAPVMADAPAPTRWQARTPDDLAPLESGECRVRVLRSGWAPASNQQQCASGQIIRLPHRAAEKFAGLDLVEIIERRAESLPDPGQA